MDLIGYAPAAEYKTGVCPRTRTREKGSIGWQWLSATKRGKRGTAAGAWLSRKEDSAGQVGGPWKPRPLLLWARCTRAMIMHAVG